MSNFALFVFCFAFLPDGHLNPVNPLAIFHQHVGPEVPSSDGDNTSEQRRGSQLLESFAHELKLEKSNILLLGPTGSGM